MGYGRTNRLRRPRPAVALVTAGGLLLLGLASGTAAAATAPPAQTVPAAGSSTTITWSGTIPGGTTPTTSCPAQISDSTNVTINVPAGFYDATKTRADFSITWSDPLGVNDEVLTVVPPAGGGATQNAD